MRRVGLQVVGCAVKPDLAAAGGKSRTGGTGMSDALSAGSPDRFGYEWHRYAEIRPEYEQQFRDWTVHLSPVDWRAKSFSMSVAAAGATAIGR